MAKISHKNRGLNFEKRIENVCEKLEQQKLALIHKVPTEITMIRNGAKIVSAFPKSDSKFVDFVGVTFEGKAIAIEAKETNEEKRFPFQNIKDSQIKFLKLWEELGGLGFYLIHFKVHNKIFFVPSEQMHNCIETIGRKSAPYDWFLENCIELDYDKINFIDYIKEDNELKGYMVHKLENGEYVLCKILNQYTDKKAAKEDLGKLLVEETNENSISKNFNKSNPLK